MSVLDVVFEPDQDGWWAVSIPALKGVRSDGRTLEEARRKIREALASAEDLGWDERRAANVAFAEDVRLPKEIETRMGRRVEALRALEQAASDVERATTDLVRRLTDEGRSLRDVAELLCLSHARVHQILGGASKAVAKDRRSAANRAVVVAEAAARYRARRRR